MTDPAMEPGPSPTPQAPFNVQPCLRDPFFGLLKDRWAMSPLGVAGLFVLVFLGGSFLFSWVSGTAFPREGLDRPFVRAYVNLIIYAVIMPLGAVLALRFYTQAEITFERLYTDGVVRAPLEDYNRFLEKLHRGYNLVGLHFVALMAALLPVAAKAYGDAHDSMVSWGDWGMGPVAVYHLAMNLLAWYTAILIGFKAAITAWAMQRVFDWPVSVQPFHPDGCGGLRLLTDISLTIALFATLAAVGVLLYISAGLSLFSVPVLFALFLLALTPLVFAACLYRAHRVMKGIKESLLWEINRQVQGPYQALSGQIAQGEVMGDAAEQVLRLQSLHSFARALPVWPTNTQIVMQILLSVALPVALIIFQFVLSWTLSILRGVASDLR